ncbi:MAG TPA: prolipoprotein diacylglyceryl transferase [Patescibacteria group bacterium]|jgi:phosphatidylglycerol:prolipoprotein diacylglycerol transferase|nr:prolipoprotein diacylglyceryl transferase [Patescibacteria group bacterium]
MEKTKVKILISTVTSIAALLAIFFFFIPAFQGRIFIPSVIRLGFFSIKLYGLVLAASILLGYFVARKNSWRFGISSEEIDELSFWLVLVGVVSARIYYILFAFDFFSQNPSEIYKIWHGGLSIYGALIGGLGFLVLNSKKKAYSLFQLLDLIALSLPLSQALGRFGNFFNQEAFGTPTNLPWKMYVSEIFRPKGFEQSRFFHPAFLYESLASVVIFIILWRLKDRMRSGCVAFAYLGLYSLARFFIESIRTDSVFVNGFRVDQIIAFFAVMLSAFMINKLLTQEKKQQT